MAQPRKEAREGGRRRRRRWVKVIIAAGNVPHHYENPDYALSTEGRVSRCEQVQCVNPMLNRNSDLQPQQDNQEPGFTQAATGPLDEASVALLHGFAAEGKWSIAAHVLAWTECAWRSAVQESWMWTGSHPPNTSVRARGASKKPTTPWRGGGGVPEMLPCRVHTR